MRLVYLAELAAGVRRGSSIGATIAACASERRLPPPMSVPPGRATASSKREVAAAAAASTIAAAGSRGRPFTAWSHSPRRPPGIQQSCDWAISMMRPNLSTPICSALCFALRTHRYQDVHPAIRRERVSVNVDMCHSCSPTVDGTSALEGCSLKVAEGGGRTPRRGYL